MKTFVLSDNWIFGKQPAPARLYLRSYGPDQEWPHSHEFHELVFVRSGSGVHETEGFRYPVYTGDVFLIRPGVMHDFRNMRDLRLANFLFHPDQLEEYWLDLRETPGYHAFFGADDRNEDRKTPRSYMTFNQAQMIRVEELIVQMDQAWAMKLPGWKFKSTIAFLELAGMICNSITPTAANASAESILIGQILQYFERNYRNPIRLDRLAGEAGKSISSLVHQFTAATGESPIRYLNRFRLEKAAELLRNSETRISEIALRTGFCDGNYFTKQFTRHFGVPPREYRRTTQPAD